MCRKSKSFAQAFSKACRDPTEFLKETPEVDFINFVGQASLVELRPRSLCETLLETPKTSEKVPFYASLGAVALRGKCTK